MNYHLRNLFNQNRLFNAVTDDSGTPGGGDPNAGGDKKPDDPNKGPEDDAKDDKGKKPTDAEAKLLKEVMEKKNALKQATEELASLREQLKQFEGIDPVKVKELLKQQEEAKQKDLEARGEWETLKKQMAEANQKALAEKDQVIQTISAEKDSLQETIAELTVGNAFGNSRFIADEMALTPAKARVVYGAHFEFKEGKVIGYDKPVGAKDRAPLVDAAGEPLSFDEALKKIVNADPDRDQLLKSKLKDGAGSKTVNRPGAPAPKQGVLVGREKIAAGLAARKK